MNYIDLELFDTSVERYLSHQMTEEEELDFKKKLANSVELKQRAATIAGTIKAMQEVGAERDKEIISELQNMSEADFRKVAKIKSPRIYLKYIKYAVAACLIGVVAFGGYWYVAYNNTVNLGKDSYSLYNDYYVVGGESRGSRFVDPDTLKSLFLNVENGMDLKSTISQLENLYELSKDEDSGYDDDIAWNLAIGHLKRGHKKEALNYLRDMVNRNQQHPEIVDIVQDLIDKIEKL